jgi:hypothetical protein
MSFMRSAGIKSTWASFLEVLVFFCVISVIFFLLCNTVFYAIGNPLSRKKNAEALQAAMVDNERVTTTLIGAIAAKQDALDAAAKIAVTPEDAPVDPDAEATDTVKLSPVEQAIALLPKTDQATEVLRDLQQAERWEFQSITDARDGLGNSAGLMLAESTEHAKVLDDLAQQIVGSTAQIDGQIDTILTAAAFLTDQQVQAALQPVEVQVHDIADILADGESIEGVVDVPEPITPVAQAIVTPPTHLGDDFVQLLKAYSDLQATSKTIQTQTAQAQSTIKGLVKSAKDQAEELLSDDAIIALVGTSDTAWAGEFNTDLLNVRQHAAQTLVDAKNPLDDARTAILAPAQSVRDAAKQARSQLHDTPWLTYSAEIDLQKELLNLADDARDLRADAKALASDDDEAPALTTEAFEPIRNGAVSISLAATKLAPMLTQADIRAGLDANTTEGADATMTTCLAEAIALQTLLATSGEGLNYNTLVPRIEEFAKDVANAAEEAQLTLDDRHQTKVREVDDQLLRIEDAAKKVLNRLTAVQTATLDAIEPQVTPGQSTGTSVSQGVAAIHLDRKFSGRFPFVKLGALFTGLPWWMWVIEFIIYILLLTIYWAPSDDRDANLCELKAFVMFVVVSTLLALIMLEIRGRWISQPVKLFYRILFPSDA